LQATPWHGASRYLSKQVVRDSRGWAQKNSGTHRFLIVKTQVTRSCFSCGPCAIREITA